jgi:hypothetical protein
VEAFYRNALANDVAAPHARRLVATVRPTGEARR